MMKSKKELKQQYKEMKTPMGAFMIKNNSNGKAFIDISTDTKSILNRYRFQLEMGGHRLKELQNDWNEYGTEAFTFEVLEELPYDKKEEKTDYSEELEILKMMWLEKIKEKGVTSLYEKG